MRSGDSAVGCESVRRYLMRYRESVSNIESLTEELERINSTAYSISANISGSGGGGSPSSDSLGASVARLSDLADRIGAEIAAYERNRDEVRRVIRRVFEVDPVCGQDLHYRYIDSKSPFAVAHDMGFTTRHERRAHQRALGIAARFM